MLNPIAAYVNGLAFGFVGTYCVLMGRPDVLGIGGPFLVMGLAAWVLAARRQAGAGA